ncbi:bifunctional folylpolyglutamate synthase/dihydrofolate synthase [bacterium]|nr:bifunctional folylpolyglutamate synthase/dihydrofolate synthase [bacterium]
MARHAGRVFRDYRGCLEWLFARRRFVMKPGLERVEYLLGSVGNPHHEFRVVHVAGTNGKGSTSSMIASILSEHRVRTGIFTSPHVIDFTERYVVDGKRISRDRVLECVEKLKPAADDIEATFFEIATAVAAMHFAAERVDVAVAEVGLGGRLDATNALDSIVSVIIGIALDHVEVLGNDTRKIASAKAGIIRPEGIVVCGATGDSLEIIRGVADALRARFVATREESRLERVSVVSTGSVFDFEYREYAYRSLGLSMLGRHQVGNAATALIAVHELSRTGLFTVSEPAVRDGLADAMSMGRLQILDRRPTVVVDVAHNTDAARALSQAINEVFEYGRVIVVLGLMSDKDAGGFIGALSEIADLFILTEPGTPRAAKPADLALVAREHRVDVNIVPSPGAAVAAAVSAADEGDLVLITGSHYTVGDVMKSLGFGEAPEE